MWLNLNYFLDFSYQRKGFEEIRFMWLNINQFLDFPYQRKGFEEIRFMWLCINLNHPDYDITSKYTFLRKVNHNYLIFFLKSINIFGKNLNYFLDIPYQRREFEEIIFMWLWINLSTASFTYLLFIIVLWIRAQLGDHSNYFVNYLIILFNLNHSNRWSGVLPKFTRKVFPPMWRYKIAFCLYKYLPYLLSLWASRIVFMSSDHTSLYCEGVRIRESIRVVLRV